MWVVALFSPFSPQVADSTHNLGAAAAAAGSFRLLLTAAGMRIHCLKKSEGQPASGGGLTDDEHVQAGTTGSIAGS